jgi:hypothetical protein
MPTTPKSPRTKSKTLTAKTPTRSTRLISFHSKKIYRIIWLDAYTETDEWHDSSSLDQEDYYCDTIGFLLEENNKKNYYSIASTLTVDGFFSGIINIPKAMVVSMKKISV